MCRKIFQKPFFIRLIIIFGDKAGFDLLLSYPHMLLFKLYLQGQAFSSDLCLYQEGNTKHKHLVKPQSNIAGTNGSSQQQCWYLVCSLYHFGRGPHVFPKTGKFNRYHINETISYQKLYLKNEKDLLMMFSSRYAPGHNSSMHSLWLSAACSAVLSTVKLLNYNLYDIFQCH